MKNITISGASTTGLGVTTTKNIALTNVQSNSNTGGGYGALLNNLSGTGNVTITQSQFDGNSSHGLYIQSNGTVTLKDVTANGNNGRGVWIDNDSVINKPVVFSGTNVFTSNNGDGVYIFTSSAVTLNNITASSNLGRGGYVSVGTSVNITLTGTNTFNSNGLAGLNLFTGGNVTLNNITADSNGNGGVYINNTNGKSSVKITGTNQFSSNSGTGLDVVSYGAITGNNITASNNTGGGYGAYLDNGSALTPQLVTLTGTNVFDSNNAYGLYIFSRGAISVSSTQANGNNQTNAYLSNNSFGSTGSVTISGTNNQFNSSINGSGLVVSSRGTVTLSNIMANANQQKGIVVDTTSAVTPRSVNLTGTNFADGNNQNNVDIQSSGAITISNLTASNSITGHGAFLLNLWNVNYPLGVTLTGTNVFNSNSIAGLYIETYGAVTASNLTANFNGTSMNFNGYGAYISNASNAITPYSVTLTGVNTFNSNYRTNLYITSDGAISVAALSANSSTAGYGAYLENSRPGSTGGVTLSGINTLNGNSQTNLYINTYGAVTLNSVTASASGAGGGAQIGISGLKAQKLNITGTNNFNNNYYDGLDIYTNGAVTINNLTATGNGTSGSFGTGAVIQNNNLPNPAKISLTGTNVFDSNFSSGLEITSSGIIAVNNLSANGNGSYGANLGNSSSVGYSSISLTGVNTFSSNTQSNLYIYANGAINITDVTSTGSGSYGAYLYNTSDVTRPQAINLLGANLFSGNDYQGLIVYSYGVVTLNNITANSNGTAGSYAGVFVDNQFGSFKPNAVTFKGTNIFNSNTGRGLDVRSLGTITLGSVTTTANNNGTVGVSLQNDFTGATGNIVITGSTFLDMNNQVNLLIETYGTVTTNNLNSTNSVSGNGVDISSFNPSGFAKSVTMNGANVFTGNASNGLDISSYGAITVSNITATSNLGYGVALYNAGSLLPANVTVNGVNSFAGNGDTGLSIDTKGAVVTNSLTATSNGGHGVSIFNQYFGSTGGVSLKGTNVFTGNAARGVTITSFGTITLNSITADGNSTIGAFVDNNASSKPVGVTLTGTNSFSSNTSGSGLEIYTIGTITTNNITASNNGNYGAYLDGAAAKITIGGTNTFNSNVNIGLSIASSGVITLNNITANNSTASAGLLAANNGGGVNATVTLTGVNTFTGNNLGGLTINSGGAVTMTKVTADNNGTATTQSGMSISAGGNITVTCGSFSGNGQNGIRFNNFNFIATLKGVTFTGGNVGADTFFNGGTGSIVTDPVCPLP